MTLNQISTTSETEQQATGLFLGFKRKREAEDEESKQIYTNLKKLELKSKSMFKVSEEKNETGLNHKRYKQIVENESNPLMGIFTNNAQQSECSSQKVLDPHKLEFLKLNYKQQISKMT